MSNDDVPRDIHARDISHDRDRRGVRWFRAVYARFTRVFSSPSVEGEVLNTDNRTIAVRQISYDVEQKRNPRKMRTLSRVEKENNMMDWNVPVLLRKYKHDALLSNCNRILQKRRRLCYGVNGMREDMLYT